MTKQEEIENNKKNINWIDEFTKWIDEDYKEDEDDILKIQHLMYGDLIIYKDGRQEYYSIGD
jgi:hypothetical protein